ncbi:MAG: epoxyqueuosine reductase [Firmicutes bacterium]|nr:epoxyqueuosine reductase [Bacillota bacterium]
MAQNLTELIIEKAKYFGASLAGVASVDVLKQSPSYMVYPEIGTIASSNVITNEEITWPKDAKSVIVLALHHPTDKPELDWWNGKGTPGNSILIKINKLLSDWLETSMNIKTYKLPYHIENGGIFLKDAAVMAGLGCIGKNNLLLTPEFGPRIRLRALLLNEDIKTSGPIEFNPCIECDEPCKKPCPTNAFDNVIYSAEKIKISSLPGQDGSYNRTLCNTSPEASIANMDNNANNNNQAEIKHSECIKFCRNCELACAAGNGN